MNNNPRKLSSLELNRIQLHCSQLYEFNLCIFINT